MLKIGDIKTKLLFAPYGQQPIANEITIIGADHFSSKNQFVTIGKFTSNDIVIDESMVSRRHCVIIRESKDRWLLVDLQSTNGTKINDLPVSRKYLAAGSYDLEVAGVNLKLGLY